MKGLLALAALPLGWFGYECIFVWGGEGSLLLGMAALGLAYTWIREWDMAEPPRNDGALERLIEMHAARPEVEENRGEETLIWDAEAGAWRE